MSSVLDTFRQSCFPQAGSTNQNVFQQFWDKVTRRSRTQPRSEAFNSRHPENQGGMIVNESGDVEIRAGHQAYDQAIGASLALLRSGHALLTAPQGIVLSGKSVSVSGKPSEGFAFLGGQFQFNPSLEEDRTIVTSTIKKSQSPDFPKLLIMVDNGGSIPEVVSFWNYFDMAALYTEKS